MAEIGLGETEPAEKDQCFAQICSASDNLLSIINDILDFSKLSSGKYDIEDENYTVASLTNDVVNIISTRVADSEIEFIVDVDPATPTMESAPPPQKTSACGESASDLILSHSSPVPPATSFTFMSGYFSMKFVIQAFSGSASWGEYMTIVEASTPSCA